MEMENGMTMVERIARVLCSIAGQNPDLAIGMEEGVPTLGWSLYRDDARLVLEALREPTEAMLDEGPPEPYMDNHVWARMIDAALKDV